MTHLKYETFILTGTDIDKERRFSEFYYRIFKDYFHIDETIISGVKEILESGRELSANEFEGNLEVFQLAYLFLHGVHESSVSSRKFYESIVKYPKIIGRLSRKARIRLCCMGSSSLLAAIGICYVINEAVVQFGFLDDVPTEIQVFVIEESHEWKRLCKHIVGCANSDYVKVKLKLVYLAENLSETISEIKMSIQQSHITIMSKFLAQFPSPDAAKRIIKKTLCNMKKGAILFYLDDKSRGHHKILKDLISGNDNFSEVENSQEQFVPQKETKTVQRDLYKSIFPFRWNANFLPITSSTWIKTPGIVFKTKSEHVHVLPKEVSGDCFRGKRSSNKLRNSTYKLTGKFAYIDMEKKNKDDTNRKEAKGASVSRYANFDDDY